jgi:2-polyprenyl-3-methyl-5-hydroxy-6-metoxy-1,4-benzoquinol methylase
LKEFERAHLCKCRSCGFIFSRQIPTESEILDYYTESYELTSYLSSVTIKRYTELLDSFEVHRKTNKILDIGCGNGYILEIAKQRGWEVYGIELTDHSIAICEKKGIQMLKGPIDINSFPAETFDVITSLEVIEHICTPKKELALLHSFLRKDGIMYVTTPNFNALLRYRLGKDYDVINYPEHLSYYTAKTLRSVFRKSGFRTLKIQASGMSLTRFKTSKGKSNQEYVSETSDDELLRHRIEKRAHLRILKRITNWWLNLFKIGNSLKGIFQKV